MKNEFEKHKTKFRQMIVEFNDDPQFRAEGALLELSELICEINPSQNLPIRILLLIIEWCADKAIYWKG